MSESQSYGFLVYYLFHGHDTCVGSFDPIAFYTGGDAEEKAQAKVKQCKTESRVSSYYKRVPIES